MHRCNLITDPFAVKCIPKYRLRRLLFTAGGGWQEWRSRRRFEHFALPEEVRPSLPESPAAAWSDTAVTPLQMSYLLEGVAAVHGASGAFCLEVGCYRGVTSRCLAEAAAPGKLVCVDPFVGYGGSEVDFAQFKNNTAHLQNLTHLRMTSGEAARRWTDGQVDFVFLDAVHDYVNTRHDLEVWMDCLRPGGLMAAHDTDTRGFAGTRRAVWELVRSGAAIHAHVENLTLLRKP